MIDIDFESLKKPNFWSCVSLKKYFNIMKKKAEGEDISRDKREILENIIKRMDLPSGIEERLNEIRAALISCNYEVKDIKIKALSRVLVGTAETFGEIPFEIGLCFDPIMNIPYIPGSTIKGAVSSATYNLLYKSKVKELAEQKDEETVRREAKEYAENECRRIFGGGKNENGGIGLIGFTDAYPVRKGKFLLYPDVMTPHYTDETRNELEVMPNPIIYFTIAPETEFRFFMFYRKHRGKRGLSSRDLADYPTERELGIVDRGLFYAFIRGVGAKTALGYSRFEILNYEKVV
ncbi:MAG: type III-B CRISPR module RAMP protein Cmr6 [Candidatus Methanomethylicia archaeon]